VNAALALLPVATFAAALHIQIQDENGLNRILWAALTPGEPMPAPVRSAR